MTRRPKPAAVPVFSDRFAAAMASFGARLLETAAINHRGNKGAVREEAFREFLRSRLPARFSVEAGEVVDPFNMSSTQLDVLIYDRTRNFSFMDGGLCILPAEALLASIEVKSRLTKAEIKKCTVAARALRQLRPFRTTLAGARNDDSDRRARYHHSVFAYSSDLGRDDWAIREASRFREQEAAGEHLIDSVYVLGRGSLNLNADLGRLEDAEGRGITNFYFTLLHFLQREAARRGDTPYRDYATRILSGKWVRLRRPSPGTP